MRLWTEANDFLNTLPTNQIKMDLIYVSIRISENKLHISPVEY